MYIKDTVNWHYKFKTECTFTTTIKNYKQVENMSLGA